MKGRLRQLALSKLWPHTGKEQSIAQAFRSSSAPPAEPASKADRKETSGELIAIQDAQTGIVVIDQRGHRHAFDPGDW
jgi:hypothetical protein